MFANPHLCRLYEMGPEGVEFLVVPVKLSKQEHLILRHAAEGLPDKTIAKELDIKLGSVRTYWDRLREKLNANNRAHAVAIFLEQKLEACEDDLAETKAALKEATTQ